MFKSSLLRSAIAAGALSLAGHAMAADVYITEWMYKGGGGEFIEFTNLGTSAVDFTGWSYDDDSEHPGTFSLSGFGLVQAGESVVITEDNAETFRAAWGLDSSVKILGGYTNNIGSDDEINLYDNLNNLVDRLTYSSGTLSTKGTSGIPTTLAALGLNDDSLWMYSAVGDIDGGHLSSNLDLGSPGSFRDVAPVPVPAAVWMFGSALTGLFGLRRRREGRRG